MTDKLVINEVYAFIAENEKGEGVCAFQGPDGHWIPMVAADKARVVSLKPLAKQIAWQEGKTIKLVRFSSRSEIEEIPGGH